MSRLSIFPLLAVGVFLTLVIYPVGKRCVSPCKSGSHGSGGYIDNLVEEMMWDREHTVRKVAATPTSFYIRN